MGLGPPTPHENGLAYAGRGSGNVALSWYARVRNESDVGAFGTPHCRIRARRAESCTREAPPGRGQTSPGGSVMDQLIERCCGLDVHRDTVAACVRVPGPNGKQRHEVRPFGTTAVELLALRDWLEAHGVTHVAMESTGVYWKPVFYVLEEAFTCLLVNAAHIKQVPGRKTDVKDCMWIAQCLEHGLLRGSFVPPAAIREIRDLTRHRKVLPAFRQALAGRFRPHHAFLVSQLLAHVDYLDEAIATVSEEVEGRLAPFAAQLTQLDTIPGINKRTAEVIIAELGVDMSCFPSDRHLASWAGICPGNNESAGKHKSGKTRKGNRWLRMTLIEAAAAATRTKDSALQARYRRVMRHRGHKKAVVAVAHAMLRAVYHLLAEGTTYREPGADYYDRRHTHRVTRRAIQLLERQGYRVVLEPAA